MVYWLFTMISGIEFDLDIDVDIDADLDIDSDSSIDASSLEFEDISNMELNKEDVVRDRRKSLKWWQIVLIYFNFVGLPFMFTFTCWVFIWWFVTVFATTMTHSYDNSFGHILFLAGMFPSLIVSKIVTTPFKSFFKYLKKDGDTPIDLVGRKGVILSSISGDKMGSAEVVAEKTPMSIYVKSIDGSEITYKQKILIIKRSDDKNYYLVQAYQD